jgi:hypothetical protein
MSVLLWGHMVPKISVRCDWISIRISSLSRGKVTTFTMSSEQPESTKVPQVALQAFLGNTLCYLFCPPFLPAFLSPSLGTRLVWPSAGPCGLFLTFTVASSDKCLAHLNLSLCLILKGPNLPQCWRADLGKQACEPGLESTYDHLYLDILLPILRSWVRPHGSTRGTAVCKASRNLLFQPSQVKSRNPWLLSKWNMCSMCPLCWISHLDSDCSESSPHTHFSGLSSYLAHKASSVLQECVVLVVMVLY